MKKLLLFSIAFLGVFGSIAIAADEDCECIQYDLNQGFYLGLIGGDNSINHGSDGLSHIGWKVGFHQGFMLGSTIGYKFFPICALPLGSLSPRIEEELSIHYNSICTEGDFKASGNMTTCSYMTNFLVDLDLNKRVTPFLGFGIGFVVADLKIDKSAYTKYHTTSFPYKNPHVILVKVAYQGIVGFSFPLRPLFELSMDYRYLYSPNVVTNQSLCFALRKFY